MRRAAQVDGNQSVIVKALRSVGASVQHLHTVGGGCPDLLVGYRGANFLLEVKPGNASDKRQRELNENELRWHESWNGQREVVLFAEDALRAIGAIR